MSHSKEIVLQYLQYVQEFKQDRALFDQLVHPDALVTTFPNLLEPFYRERNVPQLLDGMVAGSALLSLNEYKVDRIHECSDCIITEVIWKGRIRKTVGRLSENQELIAHVCFIFEFKEGKIVRQRNYDCYDPF